MRLITDPMTLLEEFARLIQTHDEYWFLTYSVSNKDFPIIDKLIRNKDRIRLLVAGANSSNVETMASLHNANVFEVHEKALSDAMTYHEGDMTRHFHPKVYLFRDTDGDWEAIIGSVNLTRKSFGMVQASVLINSHDDTDGSLNEKLKRLMLYEWYENIYHSNDYHGIERQYEKWLASIEDA